MSIQVNHSTLEGVGGQTSVTSSQSPAAKGTAPLSSTDGSAGDTVSLSNASTLVALAKGVPADRQAKLNALAAQIRSGQYQVNVNDITRAIVQDSIQG